MKRISMLLVFSALAPSVCQAYGYHHHGSDSVVRYSPYAFSYNSTGLIPGGVDYSPHALAPGRSGLVYEGARYTPYALTYGSSGLVVDYYTYPVVTCPTPVVVVRCPCPAGATATSPAHVTVTQSYSRDGDSKRDNDADPMKTIRQYLTAHGCSSIDMDYLWRAEGKMVCVSFILRDKGIAIRYRDPNVVESLAATRKNVGDGQQQAWEAFAKEFRAGGGSVYSINTSGREQIITALDACQALRPQNSTATDSVMFAKK